MLAIRYWPRQAPPALSVAQALRSRPLFASSTERARARPATSHKVNVVFEPGLPPCALNTSLGLPVLPIILTSLAKGF